MGEDKENNKEKKKQKHNHPNDQTSKPTSDFSFKPTSDVKGLKFGGQFVVKSFTIRSRTTAELARLLSLPTQQDSCSKPNTHVTKPPFPSTTAFLPTNFTILAHHAWHTLMLGLGTKKSKVVLFIFEMEAMREAMERQWPPEIPLREVTKKLIRGLSGCEDGYPEEEWGRGAVC